MATNPWTCLPTLSGTLRRRVTHAVSGVLLCLGLTATAATAAGGGDALPPIAQSNLTIEQQTTLDEMAMQADAIYEIASGQRPVTPFEPIILDWFALENQGFDADDLDPTVLFTTTAAEINAGAFAGGTLASDPEAYMEVQLDTPVITLWQDAGNAVSNPAEPAGTDEPRVIQIGTIRGSLIGQEGHIEDVNFTVVGMEFWTNEGPIAAVGIVPIGLGTPSPEEEQELEQAELILTIIGTTAAVIGIGVFVYTGVYGGPCRKTLNSLVDDCVAQCSPVYIACIPGEPCSVPLAIRRCLNCCASVNRRYDRRCDLGGFGSFAPVERLLEECVDHASDFSHPLPGDLFFLIVWNEDGTWIEP